jgi:hypothetical protein
MVSINPKLLNHVCRIVEEKSGCTIPFRLRGITIKRDRFLQMLSVMGGVPIAISLFCTRSPRY